MSDLDQIITGFDVWHLEIPVVSRRDHGIGSIEGGFEVVVLRLTTEDGTTGWGEASCWSVFTGSPEASFAGLHRYIRPHVTGRRLSERTAIMADARYAVAHVTEAKSALESALLDLEGQITGVPVWSLLGGKTQGRVPLSVSIANPDFDQDKQLLERIWDDGVRMVKLKTGFKDHAFDILRCEHIRKAYPDMRLRIDFNQGLAPEDGLPCTADLAQFDPDFIEQPVRAHEFELMAMIRAACPVPLLADESVFGPEDMVRAAREQIANGVSIKIMKSGGLTRARQTAQLAASAGWSCYGGDMHETGLAHLAGAHLIAATPEITLGCEFYHATYYVREDILSAPFPVESGEVVIPDLPGLGIAPDMDKINKFTKAQA